MHMHRLRAVGAASHTCPTLLQLLGIFHKVFLDSVGVIDGMLSGRLARVRVQATLKWLAFILTERPIWPSPGRLGLS